MECDWGCLWESNPPHRWTCVTVVSLCFREHSKLHRFSLDSILRRIGKKPIAFSPPKGDTKCDSYRNDNCHLVSDYRKNDKYFLRRPEQISSLRLFTFPSILI